MSAQPWRSLLRITARRQVHFRSRGVTAVPQLQSAAKPLHTTAPIIEQDAPLGAAQSSAQALDAARLSASESLKSDMTTISRPKVAHSPRYDSTRAPQPPSATRTAQKPLVMTESLRTHLPHLISQPPFYATIHIHGKPYLVTAGDRVRLPFLMHGVMPGDVLRLDRATTIGSRDWTLLGGSQPGSTSSETDGAEKPTFAPPIVGKTDDLPEAPYPKSSTNDIGATAGLKKPGPRAYLDDRLFICRATVMGTESEPMRIKEKTKRRQRHVKHVKSKHRYTILRISEITPRTLEELNAEAAS